MARSINKAILIGRLGRDPEVKYTAGGTAFCRFSIATDDVWKDRTSGETREKTEWHRIVAWERLAEICGQYLAKGQRVYIEGQMQSREWEDQDGNKRTSFEVRAREMMMLDGRSGSGGGSRPASTEADAGAAGAPAITDDDVPF